VPTRDTDPGVRAVRQPLRAHAQEAGHEVHPVLRAAVPRVDEVRDPVHVLRGRAAGDRRAGGAAAGAGPRAGRSRGSGRAGPRPAPAAALPGLTATRAAHSGVAARSREKRLRPAVAGGIADSAVPAAAPQAARPAEVNTAGQRAGGGASRAATRRGTGPGAANAGSGGADREARAALPMAVATVRRLPTRWAATSSAQRSVV